MHGKSSSLGRLGWLGFTLAIGLAANGANGAPKRGIPRPLPDHPGNVFLAGETISIRLPASGADRWQLLDYDDKVLVEAATRDAAVNVGRLPIGFYRLKPRAPAVGDWISLAVLAPLAAPAPKSSPVALDVAAAWFYPPEKMPTAANLCSLAGVNWVRDRLSWSEMEPRRGQFVATNRYDASARAQSDAGLQVLQVLHASPTWANANHKRFPLDLRDAYRFHREMARRWTGQVQAFEPWNEADIPMFGGHTGSEMASMQKAAWLGIKAGNPKAIACLNVFALHRQAHLEDLRDNEAWPYFDTFNLHHYEPFEKFPTIYSDFRAVSAGKPLWVSECALPVKWAGDEKLQEPTDADLRVQAERVAKTFALSLHEGAAATFYFLLPHYVEGQTQFGLLRRDLTPRPGYVALAAVGRLLADARPLGRLPGSATQQTYFFSAKPDGAKREVMVAWDSAGGSPLDLPAPPLARFDHLGRPLREDERQLSSAPVFTVFPVGTARRLGLTPPPPPPPARLDGRPSPIVFQALWPEEQLVLDKSAYRLASGKPEQIPVWVYNFGSRPAKGQLCVTTPAGWKVNFPSTVGLPPDARVALLLELEASGQISRLVETLRITGDFGRAGKPVLSMRLMNPSAGAATALPVAMQASRWQPTVSGDGKLVIKDSDGRLVVDASCAGADRWTYPTLPLHEDEVPPPDTEALALSFTLLEGSGQFRAIFEEANGSAYVADIMTPPKVGETTEALAFFEGAVHGASWSKPDPNHRLDASQIRVVKVGCNATSERVRFSFGSLRWVRYEAPRAPKSGSAQP